jgi:hypothetical protein
VQRAGGIGIARVMASLAGAGACWMCWQHTGKG